jgi:hypothetical protein
MRYMSVGLRDPVEITGQEVPAPRFIYCAAYYTEENGRRRADKITPTPQRK